MFVSAVLLVELCDWAEGIICQCVAGSNKMTTLTCCHGDEVIDA